MWGGYHDRDHGGRGVGRGIGPSAVIPGLCRPERSGHRKEVTKYIYANNRWRPRAHPPTIPRAIRIRGSYPAGPRFSHTLPVADRRNGPAPLRFLLPPTLLL